MDAEDESGGSKDELKEPVDSPKKELDPGCSIETESKGDSEGEILDLVEEVEK